MGPGTLMSLPVTPEWYLVIVAFAVLSALGSLWTPLFLALPVLALVVSVPLVQSVLSATRASFTRTPRSRVARCSRSVR